MCTTWPPIGTLSRPGISCTPLGGLGWRRFRMFHHAPWAVCNYSWCLMPREFYKSESTQPRSPCKKNHTQPRWQADRLRPPVFFTPLLDPKLFFITGLVESIPAVTRLVCRLLTSSANFVPCGRKTFFPKNSSYIWHYERTEIQSATIDKHVTNRGILDFSTVKMPTVKMPRFANCGILDFSTVLMPQIARPKKMLI